VILLAATGEAAKAGPLWLAVVLLLCLACYFLFKSMSKHLRKVRDEFPVDGVDPNAAATPDAGDAAPDAGRETPEQPSQP
jgi:hypothetical protein